MVLVETKDKTGKPVGSGSGFFIDKQTIITNLHVIKWANSATVTAVKDGSVSNLELVRTIDRQHDLCTFTAGYQGIPVKIASWKPRVGDPVYTLGSPLGVEATFSAAGNVTAIRPNRIEMDAPILRGSAGGPVTNDQGEVIGVSSFAMEGGQNLNFAVPITYVNKTIDNLPLNLAGRIALSDAEYEHLLGPVKSVQAWVSMLHRGNLQPARLYRSGEYDTFGNLTRICSFKEAGDSDCDRYERGDDTFITKAYHRENTSAETGTEWVHAQSLRFEADTHHISMEDKYLEGADRMVEVYDSFGNSVETRRNGVTVSLRVFDEDNHITEQTHLNTAREITYRSRYRYEFDANGNWIKQVAEEFDPASPQNGWVAFRITTQKIEYW